MAVVATVEGRAADVDVAVVVGLTPSVEVAVVVVARVDEVRSGVVVSGCVVDDVSVVDWRRVERVLVIGMVVDLTAVVVAIVVSGNGAHRQRRHPRMSSYHSSRAVALQMQRRASGHNKRAPVVVSAGVTVAVDDARVVVVDMRVVVAVAVAVAVVVVAVLEDWDAVDAGASVVLARTHAHCTHPCLST